MNVSISPEMETFVKQKVAGGYYRSPEDVVTASLRLLQEIEEKKLAALREDIKAAHEESQRGEATPLDIEVIIAEETKIFMERQNNKLNGSSR